MRPHQIRSPARLLAPLALVACALALALVVLSSGGDDGSESADSRTETEATTAGRRPARRVAAFYTVRTGDTLGAIAVRTGVPVDRLQQLNPELDPQALVSGQRIRLRE